MYILFLIIIIAVDILSYLTLSRGRIIKSRTAISYLKILHYLFSALSWTIIIILLIRRNEFDENPFLSLMMTLSFIFVIVWIPRVIITILSNISFWLSKAAPGLSRIINNFGISISAIIIIVLVSGNLIGRFNFKYDETEISYSDLPPALEGFRIVHISDMHLCSFHNREDKLEKVMNTINSLSPDLIVNTGDFVTLSWKEMVPFTSILGKAYGRYGKFAIPGNHDAGTYHPFYTDKDMETNVRKMDSLLKLSAYTQLKDSSLVLDINGVDIKVAGVITRGSIPDIIFGDLDKALGEEEADFTLLLSHDPNHWYNEIDSSDGIDLTLSGHTHGGQFGISLGRSRWSPASLLYPAWGGLYNKDESYLYVNRGLGTISLPVRIAMPPEITVITLKSKN